ncbi:hypothetical protein BDF14DRAFT_1874659 [Spinellus fusiger]|nr:hypothetical protein BDF14DRAFT_1874659 [Spinellus fusiger]
MTGTLKLEHEKYVPNDSWPPRFCKALFTLHDPKNTTADPILMAFSDPRRLGRLRLVEGDPLQQMPISKLGFDPLMNLPDKMTFAGLVQKRAVPIKSLLLDQGFSAGVGNWVADEILYHARIHPAHYSHALTLEQCYTIREEMERVCRVAVEAEADSSLYPEDWLMTYRWNKGKGKVSLPNGHALAFVTVGGRTSCYAPTLQPLSKSNAPAPSAKSTKTKKRSLHDSDTAKEDAVPRRTVLSRAERYALLWAAGLTCLIGYFSLPKAKKRLDIVSPQQERVAIIGCSSGIGKATALAYAARGARLVLFARRVDLLVSLERECLEKGARQVIVIAGDVTLVQDVQTIKAQALEVWGGIDTVLYCAGMISVRPFFDACGIAFHKTEGRYTATEDGSASSASVDEALERITTVNYSAAVKATRVLLPLLIETSLQPNFIVVSSMSGKVGAPTRAMYSGSKHALHGFFDSLRVEVEDYGVHIGLVCPGTVDTELRTSAVDGDLGRGRVAGSTKGKLVPGSVADRILEASDRREREVYLPAWFGHGAVWAKLIASPFVDWAAKQKYS